MRNLKWVIIVIFASLLLSSCITPQATIQTKPQEVIITIKADNPVKAEINDKDTVHKTMTIKSNQLEFSNATRIHDETAIMQLCGSISQYDVSNMWSDFYLIRAKGINKLTLFLNSPGGSAWEGRGVTDLIVRMKKSGIHVKIEACGKVMSAAVPILVSGNERIVSEGTTFLIHPATIFKFLSAEKLEDIKSQERMLNMARESYATVISKNSKLSMDDVLKMLEKDTWFTAQKAKEWGMIDEIK